MADKKTPTYIVNAVSRVDGRDVWTRVGAAWSNESTDHPLSIIINAGVSVSGKLVLSVPKTKEDGEPAAA